MNNRNLTQELWYLCYMEFLNAILIMGLFWLNTFVLSVQINFTVLYPLSLVCLILVEGSAYWLNLLMRCKGKKALGFEIIGPVYGFLKNLNITLFIGYIPLFFGMGDSIISKVLGGFFYIFAVIEHVNYFHYRLSYYTPNKYGLLIVKPLKALFAGKAPKSQIAREIEIYKNTSYKN